MSSAEHIELCLDLDPLVLQVRIALLLAAWAVSMVVINAVLLAVPVALGRWVLTLTHLPTRNDLYTAALGTFLIWALVVCVYNIVSAADISNVYVSMQRIGTWVSKVRAACSWTAFVCFFCIGAW